MTTPPKQPNGRDQGAELDRLGLLWLHLFRWLRPADLGALMYPDNPEYADRGRRLVRKWKDPKHRWIIEREIKEMGGKAVLLSRKGAEHLASLFEHKLEPAPRSGADWGDQAPGTDLDLPPGSPNASLLDALLMGDEDVMHRLPSLKMAERLEASELLREDANEPPGPRKRKRKGTHLWEPPKTWIHELRASSLAAVIRRSYPNWIVVPERQLRTGAPKAVPDLLLIAPDWPNGDGTCEKTFWAEIEHAKKSGKHLRDMAHTLIDVALNGRLIGGYQATDALLAFAPIDVNKQGHRSKHESRVRQAIKKQAQRDVPLTVVALHIDIVTKAVVGADFRMVELASDPEALELAKLEWKQDDQGVHRAEWHRRPGVFLEVSKKKDGSGWEWFVSEYRKNQQQEVDEGFASNMTEAKKAALHCAQENFMH